MNNMIFKKKAHHSFFLACFLLVFFIAFGFIPISSIFVYALTHEINTKEFILIFTTSSILWIASIVMTLYLMKRTSYRIIILCKNKIIFKSIFSKKQIEICEITSIKKENFVCGIVHGETLRTFRDYSEECINFETKKYKKTKYCLTCIPMSAIFSGSKEMAQTKVATILHSLNEKQEFVEEGLIKEIENKNIEYQKTHVVKRGDQ